ncbi:MULTISPECIES: SAM-dependent methyltransferase [Pyrobaculum]|uniref:uroporphyrinogen-III C-methyltransferase n=2 Tax=Pyrobaculum arsenaticum TaxID=121277 RepID=A4WK72_PYRAR|nr:SAM-dependent methyltransferase [Pyrobaculum arsenaticum]ABP50789.1 Uroporphyrin-III C/tetrapyrrole (Corrin/Porphyrin) methyltransferase [Pyrobaculum arsenaticum DSM 13514]MCY0891795.1 SAM-dependent methyltransferase [Pyrobaculum arsenaticum]NYR15493.1 hypothetical protein [Pyrobaculum arsenaticum]
MPIYVVGAGPGDPKLLTLWAVEVLAKADVVAYGDLVPEEIVEKFAPQALRVKIGHKKADHDAAVKALIEEAARGKTVVVLKNGDPTIFGRGIQICKEASMHGVECHVIPGVSAFAAAAALYRLEITDGAELRHVALLSYPHFSAEILASIKADTVVVYMMGDKIAEVLDVAGKICGPAAEVFICHSVSRGGGCVRLGANPLADVKKPVLIIIRRCFKQ